VVVAGETVVRAATPIYEDPPIRYSATAPRDAISKLNGPIEKGTATLAHDEAHGYLAALLRELKIEPSSQVLVFSKTSFQRDEISPSRPRALYFNDDTYVGYIPGADMIEIASTDPTLGTTFYTVQQHRAAARPQFVRETDRCLQCHGESMTQNVPGLLVRSVFPDTGGQPILSAGTFLTTHESPLAERWGGWYVTGTTGDGQPHMGNRLWKEKEGAMPEPVGGAGAAPGGSTGLPGAVDASAYLTPHSDVVALMVLEHQVEAHNRITRAVHGTLRALRDEQVINDALGEPAKAGVHSASTLDRVSSCGEPLVQYLLFAGEAPLKARVQGGSTFATEFAARGPRDPHGRSLRDFDLTSRLFRYPCSYLIYSDALAGLPELAKDYVYRRLWEVLSGKENGKAYAHLSANDRRAIMEILRQTKTDLATVWQDMEKGRH